MQDYLVLRISNRKCFRVEKPVEKTPVGYQKQRLTAIYLFRDGQATTRKQAAGLKCIGIFRFYYILSTV